MSKLSEKVAYLKGLVEGLKVNSDTNEGKILIEVIETLNLVSNKLDYVEEQVEDLGDYIDRVDNALGDVEDVLFEDEEDDDDDDDDDSCCCGHDHYDFDDDDEDIFYECPHCGAEIELETEDMELDSNPLCPQCGKEIFTDEEE